MADLADMAVRKGTVGALWQECQRRGVMEETLAAARWESNAGQRQHCVSANREIEYVCN